MTKDENGNTLDKQLLRLAFQKASIAAVRLSSWGTTTGLFDSDVEYFCNGIAEELAHDDVLDLAISARRLAESSNRFDLAKTHTVSQQFPFQITPTRWEFRTIPKELSLWDLYGRIIHSTRFYVIADDFRIKSLFGQTSDDILEAIQQAKFKSSFQPHIFLSTDRAPVLMFSVLHLAKVSLEFLEDLASELSDKEIYLGNYDT